MHMSRQLRLMFTIALLLPLAGCAVAPTTQQYAAADYGTPISQDDAMKKALAFLMANLKDPDSARCTWGFVTKGWIKDGALYGGTSRFGYTIGAGVNAKNSFGGYTGARPYQFLFQNGDLTAVIMTQPDGMTVRLL